MFGLTLRHVTTADATPLEAAQKILDGVSELAAWAIHEVRQFVARPLTHRAKTVLEEVQAHVEAPEARKTPPRQPRSARQHKEESPAHPDQTSVHMTPHPVERAPFQNGIQPHADPVKQPVGVQHPRGNQRHN